MLLLATEKKRIANWPTFWLEQSKSKDIVCGRTLDNEGVALNVLMEFGVFLSVTAVMAQNINQITFKHPFS